MHVTQDKRGLTLIEVLIALTVSSVVFMALLQTTLLSISQNTRNSARDEAVRIAEMRMSEAKSLLFTPTDDLLVSDAGDGGLAGADCPAGFLIDPDRCNGNGLLIDTDLRQVRGAGGDPDLFDFCTCRVVLAKPPPPAPAIYKQVNIWVGWIWRGEEYTHTISSIVRRDD
jgi:prepilin-type N-terminal cleavage/methylation domain-containing protein